MTTVPPENSAAHQDNHSTSGAPNSADRAPRSAWRPLHETEHIVQFYETDAFLLESLSEFVGAGLAAGEACIVVATADHRVELERRLQAAGLDVAALSASGDYVALDAAGTLATLMADRAPQLDRFAEAVGTVVARATETGRPVRIFGEMVALLWAEGQYDAALRLEALWNELHTRHDFVLLCAYPIHQFGGEALARHFSDVCGAHGRVIPAESYTSLVDGDHRLRAIVRLQQQARSLEAEIAQRKATAERLRNSELRYRRLFETSTDGILIVDAATGTITDANPFVSELLGWTHAELMGKQLWEIGLFAGLEANLHALGVLNEHQVVRYEHVALRTRDGEQREVEFVGTLDQSCGWPTVQCNLRDITDRRQAEREREQLLDRERAARLEAQEAVRIRDVFLSIASHELKTPLTTLLGNAQLLQRRSERDGNGSDTDARVARAIADQAIRLNKMILSLLDVSRIESGRLSIERAPMDLAALARRVVDELQPTLHSHSIECRLPGGAVIVDGDEVRLEQVVQNLLTNAMKYSPEGGSIVVRVERHDRQARLLVTDEGIGIPEHDLPQLFQRFFRASNAEEQYLSGMGIGLYVVREIVALHGGTVEVESREGQGSTFSVTLPLAAHSLR